MKNAARFIQKLLVRRGGLLWLLLAVLGGVVSPQVRGEIEGSGDFILNEGLVISDTGTVIGSTGCVTITGTGNVTLTGVNLSLDAILPVSDDGLPHTINASAVHGTVTKSPDQAVYDFNTPVTLTATADPGYIFEKWTLKGVESNRLLISSQNGSIRVLSILSGPTITLNAVYDYEMVAKFVPVSRIIGVSAVDLTWDQQVVGGSSLGTFKIANTGNSALTINSISYPPGFNGSWSGSIAPGGYEEVSVNFAPTAAGTFSGNITVNSDATTGAFTLPISAVAQNAYSLTGTSSFGALKTAPITRTFWQGSTVTLKAMPVAGYVFMNWTEGQKILSTQANFPLPISQNHEVWANYLPESRRLAVTVNRGAGLKKAGTKYWGTIAIKNTGNLPVCLSDVRLQGIGPKRTLVKGSKSGTIQPGTTWYVSVILSPPLGKFYQIRVRAIAKDLTAPANYVDLTM